MLLPSCAPALRKPFAPGTLTPRPSGIFACRAWSCPVTMPHIPHSVIAGAPAFVARLAHLAEPWKTRYSDSTALATAVMSVHLGAMLVAGGLAIAADRGTWRAARAARPGGRRRQLVEIGGTHRPVTIALALVMLSGVLIFLSDVETFATSIAFWAKMALVALLLGNGLVMMRAETALRRGALGGAEGVERWWRVLRGSAVASAVLWVATVFAGTVLGSV